MLSAFSIRVLSLGFTSLIAFTCSGCLIAGAAPPGRTDIGPAFVAAGDDSMMTIRFSAGMHAASFSKKRVPYDLGLGYVLKTGEQVPVDPNDPENNKTEPRLHHGGYIEAAYGFQLGSEEWSRGWAGARGEVTGDGGWGMLGRLAWESSMWVEGGGSGGGSRSGGVGVAYGRLGYGFFLEGGYQSMPENDQRRIEGVLISLGLSLRFPAFAVAMLVWPK